MPIAAKLLRVRRAMRRYGVGGSARQAVTLVRSLPARRRARAAERAFDAELGVDTGGIVRLHELSFDSDNKDLGSRYEATSPEYFELIMSQLDLGDGELTFVDLGAGKGRALLMASKLPFRRLVGVEFSPELTDVARSNAAAWAARHPEAPPMELQCLDATRYEFPDEPLLVYMYNPFEAPVMVQVLENLRASLERSPRRVLVLMMSRKVPLEALADAGFAPSTPGELFLPTAVGASA